MNVLLLTVQPRNLAAGDGVPGVIARFIQQDWKEQEA